MPKYIDFDALGVQSCNPDVFVNKGYAEGWNSLMRMLYDAPAADVVSVVRCKDCRHTKTDGIDAIYCQKWDRWEMPPNAYCYLGEKRKAEPPKEE